MHQVIWLRFFRVSATRVQVELKDKNIGICRETLRESEAQFRGAQIKHLSMLDALLDLHHLQTTVSCLLPNLILILNFVLFRKFLKTNESIFFSGPLKKKYKATVIAVKSDHPNKGYKTPKKYDLAIVTQHQATWYVPRNFAVWLGLEGPWLLITPPSVE